MSTAVWVALQGRTRIIDFQTLDKFNAWGERVIPRLRKNARTKWYIVKRWQMLRILGSLPGGCPLTEIERRKLDSREMWKFIHDLVRECEHKFSPKIK